tara:strand:- start:3 stop:134 length:132 start_codon:yes stop_codon:yes gene_type:complete
VQGKKLKEMTARIEQIFLGLKHPSETAAVIDACNIIYNNSWAT